MLRKIIFPFGLGLLLTLALVACSSDDNSPSTADKLIGTWTISNVDVDASVGTQSLSDFLVEVLDYSPAEAATLVGLLEASLISEVNGTITFKADNTYESNFNGSPDTGTWELNADGSKLTLDKGTADETVLTINSITTASLNVTFEQEVSEDLDDDDTTPDTTIAAEATVTLTK